MPDLARLRVQERQGQAAQRRASHQGKKADAEIDEGALDTGLPMG